MKYRYILFTLFATVLFLAVLTPAAAFADGGCLPLNNGGTTDKQVCLTPSVAPFSINSQTNNQQQNNGGQPVYPPSKTKTTPNTGPEDWMLPSLALAGIFGVYMRKKTNSLLKTA